MYHAPSLLLQAPLLLSTVQQERKSFRFARKGSWWTMPPSLPSLGSGCGCREKLPSLPSPRRLRPGVKPPCRKWHQLFASGNQLHQHLSSCRARRPATLTSPPAPPSHKHKQPAVPLEPSTFSDFASAPPAKARRFTHHYTSVGAIEAVNLGGTI